MEGTEYLENNATLERQQITVIFDQSARSAPISAAAAEHSIGILFLQRSRLHLSLTVLSEFLFSPWKGISGVRAF